MPWSCGVEVIVNRLMSARPWRERGVVRPTNDQYRIVTLAKIGTNLQILGRDSQAIVPQPFSPMTFISPSMPLEAGEVVQKSLFPTIQSLSHKGSSGNSSKHVFRVLPNFANNVVRTQLHEHFQNLLGWWLAVVVDRVNAAAPFAVRTD